MSSVRRKAPAANTIVYGKADASYIDLFIHLRDDCARLPMPWSSATIDCILLASPNALTAVSETLRKWS